MKRFRKLSIQYKLIVIMMVLSGFMLMLGSVAFVVKEGLMLRYIVHRNLASLTEVIGLNSVSALVFNDKQAAEENLNSLRAMPYIIAACIYDASQTVFAQYSKDDAPESSFQFMDVGHQIRGHWLFLSQAIFFEKERIGTLVVQYDIQEMLSGMKHATMIFVAIMGVGFLIALFLSHSLQRIISEPILYLAEKAKQISQIKDCSIRVEKCEFYQDEIGILIDGFNEMLCEIHKQEQQIREHQEKEIRSHQEYLTA